MTTIKLNNGKLMPMVGLGTYAREAKPGQYREAVESAIDAGYRHIDTAACYRNEEEVGAGIAAKIAQGVVKREDLFVTTKLWNDCHAEDQVEPALEASLKRLGLDYVDLYLVHWPVSVDSIGADLAIDLAATWRGMERAAARGRARAVGVSNYNKQQLDALLSYATVKPAVNQIEVNPTLSQHALVAHCLGRGVAPVAYTPLGLLSEARPEFAGLDAVKTDPRLAGVAARHGKTKAQVALRWLLQRNIVVIPKSFTKARIAENIDLFDFELSADEMKTMDSFNIGHRCVPATTFSKLTNYPF